MYQNFGRARLSDFFGDMVVYRNLEPLDRRIKGLKAAGYKMGIDSDRIPRKLDKEYAKAARWFVEEAQRLRGVSAALQEVVFLGDTLLNDGRAYANLRKLTGWQGTCFIGAERLQQAPATEINDTEQLYSANRWAALGQFTQWSVEQGIKFNQSTVVLVDIDKTALGAKGRNDHVIDAARLEGIFRTMHEVLGDNFNRGQFEREYDQINRARYHFLTEDNQDYVAYICLALNSGLVRLDEMSIEIENKGLENFEQFVRWVESRLMSVNAPLEDLRQVHETIRTSVRLGDPTPFKRFRRAEFAATALRMGQMADSTPVESLLKQEITLTQEVCELVEWLQARNCLLLCLSDKPDEASCPDLRDHSDMQPLHRTETHRVGTSIRELLQNI